MTDKQTAAGTALHRFELQLAPLWRLASEGHEPSYHQALELIARTLRAYFARHAGQAQGEVEDLVQETLLAVHLKRSSYSSDYPISAWVYGIARHKLVDAWRRWGRREQLHDSMDDLDELQDPASGGQAAEAQRDLLGLLEQLPQAQAQAIRLIKLQGLSLAEASAQTGVSVAALKVQVHRGLHKMAQWIRGTT